MKENKKNNMKGDELSKSKAREQEKRLKYILDNTTGRNKAFAIWFVIHWQSISKLFKVLPLLIISVFALNFTTQTVAGINLFEIVLRYSQEIFVFNIESKDSNTKFNSQNTVYTTSNEFNDLNEIENVYKVNILKPNYIPNSFEIEKISYNEDECKTNIIINTIYKSSTSNETLVYNIYFNESTKNDSQLIHEKTNDNVEKGHFKFNNSEITYYKFKNIDWNVVVWYYNNALYELYGIKSDDELNKIMNSLYL